MSLFDPFDLHGLALPNRMVMAPMTRTRASDDHVPGPMMAEYYSQRASAGLIVSECTEISTQTHGILRAPGLYRDDQVAGWRKVTDSVHAAGGRIYAQIWHCGRISHPDLLGGALPVAPSAVKAEGEIFLPSGIKAPFPTPRALELKEIPPIIEAFGAATRRARQAGFDGVELHGAFGYLPDQFLQDGTNHRTDGYGGNVHNRARFMMEVIDEMISAWEPARLGVKLSPSNRFYGAFCSNAYETYAHVIQALVAEKVGYIHLMEPSAADLKTGTVQIEHVVQSFRPLIPGVVIANGGFDKARAEAVLVSGQANLVSFGVPYVANPDLVERFRRDAPLNTPDPATFYSEGPHGYTDYPSLAA